MKALFFSTLVSILFSSLLSAQEEAKATKIKTPGDLRSTPQLCSSKEDMAKFIQQTNDEVATSICEFAEESKWPSSLETLDKRNAGWRDKMVDYNCYHIADLTNGVILLWVPMDKNTHMPESMRDKSDFLVTIPATSCVMGDKVSLTGTTENEAEESVDKPKVDLNAKGFELQLHSVLIDFEFAFKTINGGEKPKENDLDFGGDYFSKIQLEGAAEPCYLHKQMLTKDFTFIAPMGDFSDKAQARKRFDEVVAKIDKSRFACCSMVKSDLMEHDNLVSQPYLTFDMSDKMAPVYDNMVLEVEMHKSFDFKDNKMVDRFSVVLRVGPIK